ncbi:Crp/Fnr family transcriptional regulator [Epilithonimonas zeae]|uniref:Crp/Fnr family transcriptional regulator n=1 Tax=Epilithonimonas zeae TaxID=1416779 RepID=UPI00200FE1EB|nr:Crp/Fnr family transcriptional regulator [Epilithonimonas zeae]UQB69387.1 Crp/Fnr family transcriptional regulator [Epilithonimonas zeae]
MVIEELILESLGADTEHHAAGNTIFSEGSTPNYYFQIVEGEVKLNNYSEDGKETIQDILGKGQSFGESMLFTDNSYPVNAIALSSCKILKLPKQKFLELLEKHPENYLDTIKSISNSMYFRYVMGQYLSSQNPVSKLRTFMDYLKGMQTDCREPYSFQIPLTRQQMASFTGLCVETTIRTLKVMEKNKIVKIKNHKVLY